MRGTGHREVVSVEPERGDGTMPGSEDEEVQRHNLSHSGSVRFFQILARWPGSGWATQLFYPGTV